METTKSLPLHVVTINLATGEEVPDKIIDHNNNSDRIWLGRHCYWAFRNNHRVETTPLCDWRAVQEEEETA